MDRLPEETDLIERLAREAGFEVMPNGEINDGIETAADFSSDLRRFARLVAEECAKVCYDKRLDTSVLTSYPPQSSAAYAAASAMRRKFKAPA
jgi:hypothetical protein